MFEMFLGQTDRKGGCQDPGISREKNNSFSSFLVSAVVHLTWENEKEKLKLRTFICMLLSQTDCRIWTPKEIFPLQVWFTGPLHFSYFVFQHRAWLIGSYKKST